ncbi:MAG: hypothetical protein ACI9SC_000988 [Gammaproteobacteria bacterium]|jgi:uncharacterized protein (UPF0276 family)
MSSQIDNLPTLGLGASLSLSALPDPVKLVQAKGGPAFVEYAGLVDVDQIIDEVERIRKAGAPVLYHPSYINFCGSHPNSEAWLRATALHIETVGSAWFAQDCAYCFWEEGPGYSTQLGYFIPPIFNRASLERAISRVKEVQAIVPVPVAIEPPPLSFVVGTMPLFSFFGELARETDCAILLDMGHLVSYEMASGNKVRDALQDLPCERVVEVHIAGGRLKKGEAGPIYIDAHESETLDQTWTMLEEMLPVLPNLKAVCYECEGVDETRVLSMLLRLRQMIKKHSVSSNLLAKLEETL